MMENFISFVWGFAEATLFFFVPDIGLSVIALQGANNGLVACVYAVAGAMVGGGIMYYWGSNHMEMVTQVLEKIPAIRPMDTQKVRHDLEKYGIKAMLWGPLLGIPYKIYASYAHLVTSVLIFLLVSIPARIVRFIIVVLVVPYVFNAYFPGTSHSWRVQVVLVLWAIVYVFYFFIKRKR
ncbi:MAG: hypothetical protein JNM55_01180 [Anaerolineales bacterium]|nr:hypothetical protein [Anaerolineales bacterium]